MPGNRSRCDRGFLHPCPGHHTIPGKERNSPSKSTIPVLRGTEKKEKKTLETHRRARTKIANIAHQKFMTRDSVSEAGELSRRHGARGCGATIDSSDFCDRATQDRTLRGNSGISPKTGGTKDVPGQAPVMAEECSAEIY